MPELNPSSVSEVYVTEGSRFDKESSVTGKHERLKHLILLAENMEGYGNIVKIVSRGFTEGFYRKPRVDHDLLCQFNKGIIALSACIQGEVPQYILQDNPEGARRAIEWYIETYGKDNFF